MILDRCGFSSSLLPKLGNLIKNKCLIPFLKPFESDQISVENEPPSRAHINVQYLFKGSKSLESQLILVVIREIAEKLTS